MKKTPDSVIQAVQEARRSGLVYAELVEEFNLSKATISVICSNMHLTDEEQTLVKERTLARKPKAPYTESAKARAREGHVKGGQQAQKKLKAEGKKPFRPKPMLTPEDQRSVNKAKQLARYHNFRKEAIEKLGGKCSICGSIDHLFIIRKEDAEQFSVSSLWTHRKEVRDHRIPQCYLLCHDHKFEKLHRKGTLTHGTYWAAYKKKCDCEDCEEYRANRALERREDRLYAKGVDPTRLV